MDSILQLLGFGVLAAGGNLIGGYMITRSNKPSLTRLKYLIALGAGFMLAAVFLEVIPEVAEQWHEDLGVAMGWLLVGYLLIQLAEHTVAPHFHFGEETHTGEMVKHGAAMTAVMALSVHTFFDGVAIASGLLTSFRLGLLLFIAILLHKVPEGFTVASIVLSSGRTSRTAMQATLFIALATFTGMIMVAMIRPAIKYTLPLSAGVTLYIAASDLIPEVNHEGRHEGGDEGGHEGGKKISLLVFGGVALFYIAHLLLHSAIGK